MTRLSETGKFTEDILTASKEKARQIVEEAEAEHRHLLEEAASALSREENEILHNAQTEAEGIKRRDISEVRHQAKLLEQSEKDKLLSSVLEEVKLRLRESTKDQDTYFRYLINLATDAISHLGMEHVAIHFTSEDLNRLNITQLTREVEKLAPRVKVEVSKEPVDASGGVVVASNDGRIRLVNTFEQRLEALEPRLLIEAGRILFNEK